MTLASPTHPHHRRRLFRHVRRHRVAQAGRRGRPGRDRPRLAQLRRRHQPGRRDAARLRHAGHPGRVPARRATPADGVQIYLPDGTQIGRAAHAAHRRARRARRRRASCGRCWPHPGRGHARVGHEGAPGLHLHHTSSRTPTAWTSSFTDGQRRRYDLVIGADGLYSKVREALFPDAPKPRYSGQAVWRAVLPRPPEVSTAMMWMGRVKPGVNPVSKDADVPVRHRAPAEQRPRRPRELRAAAARAARAVPARRCCSGSREQIDAAVADRLPPAGRPAAAAALVRRPRGADRRHRACDHAAPGQRRVHRHRGRASCWPRRSAAAPAWPRRCTAFEARRWERCRMVVENSFRLGEIEMTGGEQGRARADHARLADGIGPTDLNEECRHDPHRQLAAAASR